MWEDRPYASSPFGSFVHRARVTWWLIGITTGAHVLRTVLDAFAPEWGHAIAEYAPTSYEGWMSLELWRPFTYMLVHGDVRHLLFNMLFLGVAGTMLEPRIGSRAFLRLYVLSGLVGGASPLFHHGSTVGASGAINGVLVALAILMPNVIILFMFLLPMKIKWVVAILLGIDLLNLISRESPLTDSVCHVLGALTGFWIAFMVPRVVQPWLDRRRQDRVRREETARITKEVDEERELDRLLEKISREGLPSLTEDERDFLKRVSGKYQGSRRS
jgi:membrane associated rhomboid family serine protease